MQLRKITSALPDKYVSLVLCWSLGLSLGIYTGKPFCGMLSTFLRASCYFHNAFLVPVALLPITLIWFAAKRSAPGLIFPVLFLKAFGDGFLLLAIAAAFGSASWLMGILVFFTDRIATIFLAFFSVLCLDSNDYHIDRWYFAFLFLIIAVLVFDHFYISRNLIYLMP